MIDFTMLNENQREAVEWGNGPLLVLAGPGSGKTSVLTLRIARLMRDHGNASALALTFTNKAAAEMRERVDGLLGERVGRTHLSTFHSFAADILRQHGSHVGLRPDFGLLTQIEDRLAILEEVIPELPDQAGLPTDRRNLLAFVDRLFAESYDGGEEAASLKSLPAWVPVLHQRYCNALVAGNHLDFGSLLYLAARLLREKPAVARVVRLGWTHVCVDEFQDTNKAQYDLLRLIAPSRQHNLFVVADDDQIVYQWNGASPERFHDLRRDYDLEVVQLPECYRCPPSVIELANQLIEHNTVRISGKKPLTVRDRNIPYGDVVRHRVLASPEQEAEFVARDIADRDLRASDCVVLGRTGRLIANAANALEQADRPAHVVRAKRDFDSPAVRVFAEALRLANAPHDRVVLRRLCFAWNQLAGASLDPHAVGAAANLVGGDFLRAWTDAAGGSAAGGWAEGLQRLRADLVDRRVFFPAVEWFLEAGWRNWTDEDTMEVTEEETQTWKRLDQEIRTECGPGLTLSSYVHRLDLSSKHTTPDANDLRCMTVHGSKGLEFKHVYLIGMAQEVFPSFLALRKGPASREVEEERRSCFVAITRAEETLTLTRSETYYRYRKAPSQFLAEMGLNGGDTRRRG